MRLDVSRLAVLSLTLVASCARPPVSTSSPSPTAATGSAQTPAADTRGTAPGAQANAAQRPRRAPPNPVVQDSIRRATVAKLMAQIAGKESLPAGTVFKNVQLLKEMPAAEFLKNMDEIYGRGLGMVCTGCHVDGKWDEDTRKNKIIARQMQRMTNELNADKLPKIKELDEDWHHVSCVMCHRGTGHAANTMAVPPAPTTAPSTTPPPSGAR